MPEEALPSQFEEEVGYLNRTVNANESLANVDPLVREAIYALDDEDYLEEDIDDDFFISLNSDTLPNDAYHEDENEDSDQEDWMNSYMK